MSNRTKCLIVIGVVVLATLVVVLYIKYPTYPEHTQFAAYLVGGLLLLLQIGVSSYRATVAEKTAKAAQKTSEIAQITAEAAQKTAEAMQKTAESTEKGNVAERFKNAIEHLGNKSASVRLGGIYALHHIAKEEENYRVRVFEILCAHIRETTTQKKYKPIVQVHDVFSVDGVDRSDGIECPAIEIQSVLKLLFGGADDRKIYKNRIANLEGANLQGAELVGLDLESTNLAFSNLENAILNSSKFSEVDFCKANLKGALLLGYDFRGASFLDANLEYAYIKNTSGLKASQLVRAKSLYNADMPDKLKKILYKKNPSLFKPTKK